MSASNNDLTINGPGLSFVSPLLANFTLQGGGVVSWTGTNLTWSTRVLVTPLPASTQGIVAQNGYFEMVMPAPGTFINRQTNEWVTIVGVTASGIPLQQWDALYYIIPLGGAKDTDNNNFYIVNYTGTLWTPYPNWILLAVLNGDPPSGALKWLPGQITLPDPGAVRQSVVSFNTTTGYRSWCPDSLAYSVGATALIQGFTKNRQVSFAIQQYYHICTLFLPQGGNQARITVNCLNDYRMNAAGASSTPIPKQPYNVYNATTKITTNPVQNYVLEINIYSSNGGINSSSFPFTYTGGSNACSAAPTGSILATNGVFWGGFAINNTPRSTCLGIFLAPQPSDIQLCRCLDDRLC
jgi:hypothetical protein